MRLFDKKFSYYVLLVNSTYLQSKTSMIGRDKAAWAEMLRSSSIFEKIKGFGGRTNTIIYKYPKCPPTQQFLVFFGGDTQDLQCNMERNRDSHPYIEWSLENTAEILFNRFPKHHILIIRPARMSIIQGIAFTCFDNFVPGDKYGIPSFCKTHNAIKHLQNLIGSFCSRVLSTEQKEKTIYDINHINYTLIGFSKGCVVLNQLLHDISTIMDEADTQTEEYTFLRKIKSMWWLDGGHSGFKDTWVTDPHILEQFAKLNADIQIHVTPYQISDTRRPWIRQEENHFYHTLKNAGVSVNRQIHFADYPPSLLYHFNLLKNISDPAQESICSP